MPRFFDDYSNTYLTHDSSAGRKQQRRGWKFRENFKLHYERHLTEWRSGPYGLAAAQQAFLKAKGSEAAPELPPGWTSELDEATGITFYSHEESGRRTWVRPGFRPPPIGGGPSMGGGGGGHRGPPNNFNRGPPPNNFNRGAPHHRGGGGGFLPNNRGGGPPPHHHGGPPPHGNFPPNVPPPFGQGPPPFGQGPPPPHIMGPPGGGPPPQFMQPPPFGARPPMMNAPPGGPPPSAPPS
eukprot:CAMPEP_0195509816 /NCGR_PEP_ID=MMETSP0794_2-20130614/2644_1 /TAXON_ID=515487 /ORGANISM="Stephanopyxis turris, Strain CCMP 815" /LENGTH=237 /DNA_ID=CAMNT_0040637121 /DNA_START=116 /DNA_END=829 /DNA_ORIENTATION=-